MANIGDKVVYFHGKEDNRFHEGKDSHPAEVTVAYTDDSVDLVILNEEGRGTIPIKNVLHKKDKARDKDSAYWVEFE